MSFKNVLAAQKATPKATPKATTIEMQEISESDESLPYSIFEIDIDNDPGPKRYDIYIYSELRPPRSMLRWSAWSPTAGRATHMSST